MSHPPVQIQCANPDCLHADNPLGQAVCDRCQTPLLYRYLWALDAAHIPVDTMVADRYWVVRPQVWLDTQPGQGADVPTLMPNSMLPYLQLYGQRLHTPGLYGFCAEAEDTAAIALLDNAPIDSTGQLLPNLATVWQSTAPARQLYWLWQILQLWQPLQGLEVSRSLLIPENLHVEGWRVRLRELTSDRPPSPGAEMETEAPADSDSSPDAEGSGLPLLKDLGNLWLAWVDTASAAIAAPLRHLCEQMQTAEETALEAIAAQLNALLLEQVAQLPLQVESVGATTTGPQRTHNEDACFPDESTQADPLIPYVGIICDGIGGHEGGEVASQLALRSLKLQTRALLAELLEQAEPLSPTVVAQQLTGMVRVVNNLIAAQNDSQGRALRQRMGTTLVMALQLPQPLPNQGGNAHELYLVHVGDSRAYWITPEYCHQLTVDDDVVTREVVMGRSPYQEAIRRPDGGALIQALGTRGSELLDINVQRFVIEEDGLLLLCSDGLSDYDRVEQSWTAIAQSVFKDQEPLQGVAQAWIDLANQLNGHDNTSVVLLRCLVSGAAESSRETGAVASGLEPLPDAKVLLPALNVEELADSSRALLYEEDAAPPMPEPSAPPVRSSWKPVPSGVRLLALLVLGLVAAVLGLAIWQQMNPSPPPPPPTQSS